MSGKDDVKPEKNVGKKKEQKSLAANLDWLQSPVTKHFFLIILFDNPLNYNQTNTMTIKAGH